MSSTPSAADGDTLPVGAIIKPYVSEKWVRETIKRLYGMGVKSIRELNSYDDRNYFVQVNEEHTNSYIDAIRPEGYVLKVLNSRDSQKGDYVEAMQSLIVHACDKGILTSRPVKSVTGKLMHLEDIPISDPKTGDCEVKTKEHMVRLFTYIPGEILVRAPYTSRLCYQVGKYCGKLDKKLKTFHHRFYDTYTTIWSLTNIPKLADFVFAVENVSDRKMVNQIMDAFQQEVIPFCSELQAGMIHGDLNEQNILVRQGNSGEYDVCGIIDFGDATQSYILFEIAITMSYVMLDSKVIDPLDAAGHALAGYVSEMALTEREFSALRVCVAARLTQSLVMGAYTYSLDRSNKYVLTTAARGWPCLRNLWSTPSDHLKERWHIILSTYNN